MKLFKMREINEAIAYAKDGGQALHLHRIIVDYNKAPQCFINAIKNGKDIAHLFDQDKERLITIAKKLGVRVILIEREGRSGQHIDLCGKPLECAIKYVERNTV